MLGRKVNHKVFGCGTITELTSAYLTVNFGDSEKKFVYPDAFEKYLTSTDPELMEQVDKDIQSKKSAHSNSVLSANHLSATPTQPQMRSQKHAKKVERSNIAFKCNYCDGGKEQNHIGFQGVCSDSILKTNYPVTPRQKRSRCRSNRGIIDSPTPLFTPFCRFRYRSRGQIHSHQYPRTSSTNDPFLKWFSYASRMMRIAMSTSPF